MNKQDYTITFAVNQPVEEIFKKINRVTAWWTENLDGNTQKLNDSFTVKFWDMHISTQKIIELIPNKKVVWLVTDSNLTFIKDKNEWTNTTISFELMKTGNETAVVFTHHGLVPEIECYKDCTKGWDYYINGSLFPFITDGKGKPETKE